jgi:serine/threonine protein kinase
LKIASLCSASILPTIPTTFPSHEYRSPELLLGTLSPREDEPLAVDLWSLGCVIAELGRIFATRNRYEDPIFVVNFEVDGLPDKPESKAPVLDRSIYTDARYVLKIASVLNGGMLPPVDVWPNINKRQHYDKVVSLMEYNRKKNPTKFGSHGIVGNGENTLQQYCKEDSSDAIVTEIVKALLRWSPEKRASPKMILQRIGKYRIAHKTYI